MNGYELLLLLQKNTNVFFPPGCWGGLVTLSPALHPLPSHHCQHWGFFKYLNAC